uniref:MacB-like periplasmic core domain-containing protein n=1 Tax=uncultured prokaryote TaxID=198431 RepID=A0A0H5Q3U5_9ZZZZ|nr:hypothetical protein [uncultured prokaryote]
MQRKETNSRQLGKALNLFPLIGGLFPLPLLFLCSEHIAFGNHQKLNLRIFKASVKIAVSHKNLSRLNLLCFLVRTEGAKIILPQIPGQTAGSGSGARQKNHPVFLLFPPLQILNQHFKAALIRIHILHTDAVFLFHCHSRQLLLQSGQIHRIGPLRPGQNLLYRINKMRSFLTMLGIIIGIGSVISIVSIGDTMRGMFADLYKDVGLTQAYISIGYWLEEVRQSDYFTLDDMERIREVFGEEIAYMDCSSGVSANAQNGRTQVKFNYEGIDWNYQDVQPVNMVYGRYLNEADVKGRRYLGFSVPRIHPLSPPLTGC